MFSYKLIGFDRIHIAMNYVISVVGGHHMTIEFKGMIGVAAIYIIIYIPLMYMHFYEWSMSEISPVCLPPHQCC